MSKRIALGFAWLLHALLFLAPPAAAQRGAAQRPVDRFDCSQMRGLQCREEERAALLAFYGLPTAESRLAAGSEMYRVFIFDAWMRHHVAIIVERAPGSSPTLTLQAPPRPGRAGAAPEAVPGASVPIPIRSWYALRRRAAYFDRLMVPEPVRPGDIHICAGHGPLYFVESTDPDSREDRRLRRSGLSDCQQGLAESFALEIALLAAEVIPACAALDEDPSSHVAERLRACAILSGDGAAAAEVYDLMRPLLAAERERPSAQQLASLFEGAQLGGPGSGTGAGPEQLWLQALAGGERAQFVVERVHAQSRDHAIVDGLLRRWHRLEREDDGPPFRVEEAPVQLLWTRAWGSDFEMARLTLGAYAPAPDRCNSTDRKRRAVDC
jgi:hypothetical protein